jgi:hypothetical protein
MSDWVIKDMFTGEEKPLPKHDPNNPTEAWIEGWNDLMDEGSNYNPYTEGTLEWHDYEDGYEEAGRD